MAREDLAEILKEAGGDKSKVSDPEAFAEAWRMAPIAEEEALLSRAGDLMRMGAVCTDEILSDHTLLKTWVTEASCRPDIIAKEREREDLANLQHRLPTLTWEGPKGKRVLEHGTIAEYLRDRFSTVSFNKTLYVYDSGVFRPNTGDLEARIREIINLADVKCSITRETRDILAYTATYNRHLIYPFNREKNLIPVANGVVRIDYLTGDIALLPHSPEFKFNYKLPVVYDPEADSEAFHEEVLSQYVEDQDLPTLYQIPAQALLQAQGTKPYKKSYILQGSQDAGKTTYLEWLLSLFGEENVSHASLHQLGMDRFVYAVLEGKMLNSYDDLADVPLQNIGPFKTLTGGFDHQVERKHQQPYQSLIGAVHVFSCNAPPEVPEKVLYDSAFWSRWEYLHFPNCFEIDTTFKERYFTRENLSGSFNKIIEMMVKIHQEGLAVNHSPSEVKEEWQTASDPFKKFIDDHMMYSEKENTFPKQHLLEAFQDYCRERCVNERKIPTTLKALSDKAFQNGFKDKRAMVAGERSHEYGSYRIWKPESKYRQGHELARKAGPNKTL